MAPSAAEGFTLTFPFAADFARADFTDLEAAGMMAEV
jgi:hypothetical protein